MVRRRLALVTDAWYPQVNGVVTTLEHAVAEIAAFGIDTWVVEPGLFTTFPLPSYEEIRLAANPWRVGQLLREIQPDCVHIATEGPLGIAARQAMMHWGVPFTTSLHTKFPEYVHQRWRLPVRWGYAYLRWFHRPARATLVTTPTQQRELADWGLSHLVVWGRGVDVDAFAPRERQPHSEPHLLYVGRVAVEKNVRAFLDLDTPGRKTVVGDGPQRSELQAAYPEVDFVGYKRGAELTAYYADADVFVFPSLTDTFGLVMLEANACGTPVAAFPVTGPVDVVVEGVNGALDHDLDAAVRRAMQIHRSRCRAHAETQSWERVGQAFAAQLARIRWEHGAPARWRRAGRVLDGGPPPSAYMQAVAVADRH